MRWKQFILNFQHGLLSGNFKTKDALKKAVKTQVFAAFFYSINQKTKMNQTQKHILYIQIK